MFKKEIKELFELAWRVSNETDYFVSFYITSHVHLCDIDIMNSKWDSNRKKDGNYTIYFDSKLLKKESAKQCKLAKAHLLRLNHLEYHCAGGVFSNGKKNPVRGDGSDNVYCFFKAV